MTEQDATLRGRAYDELDRKPLHAVDLLAPTWEAPPFGLPARDLIEELSRRIRGLENARRPIARAARSMLCEEAQEYQRSLDLVLYRLAGFSDDEIAGLEDRLAHML